MTAIDDTRADTDTEAADAERCAIGVCMLSATALDAVADILGADDIAGGPNQIVYAAILDMREHGTAVDAVTVAEELRRTGQLARIGGAGHLHTLTAAVPHTGSGGYYAEIVHKEAIRRRLTGAGHAIAAMGTVTDGTDLAEILDRARETVDSVAAEHRGANPARSVADLLPDTLDRLERPATRGIPTGLTDIDHMYAGHQPGKMIVIGARAHMGKTVLAMTMLRNAAAAGHPAMMLSLEMSYDDLEERLIASEAKVDLSHITRRELTEADWSRVAAAVPRLNALPLYMVDTTGLTLGDLRDRIRRGKRDHGIGLYCVDYLQLMRAPKAGSREQEVAALSREIKIMAKEMDVAIILVAQLNRGPEQRADKRPVMSDLRESGALEQDADAVFLLHREDYYDHESPRAGEADVIAAKNRLGHCATGVVAWQGHYARCVNMAGS